MPVARLVSHLVVLLVGLACPLLAQIPDPPPTQFAETGLTVPDGTPVKLRFAEALWGIEWSFRVRTNHAKVGDKARLVVAEDVSVADKIIIRKGSPAQATVAGVWLPTRDKNGVEVPCTCISFVFDWVETIDREKISLRANLKGKVSGKGDAKSKSFTFDVFSTPTGNVARTLHLGRGLWEAMTFQSLVKSIHQKTWIPPGTRLDSFVNGNHYLDSAAVAEAQAQLPLLNENALVMIYRTKGQKEVEPEVSCDNHAIGHLGTRQFASLELLPGEHSCKVNSEDPLTFTAQGGNEHYIYLQYSGLSGKWKLALVDRQEGEDGVSQADPMGQSAPASPAGKPMPADISM
jgi:hypothetical protein